jgi:two-component system, NtrC family, sensor histidine kinase PilS
VLTQWPALRPLCEAVELAQKEERWPDTGRPIVLALSASVKRTLRLRVRFTRSAWLDDGAVGEPHSEGLCVLLLEDDRAAQARLRQEKLAAMGRVSAGIAHEFRNPLAAISQANALLLEEPLNADQLQLTQMVADNVRRLQRIVDDVLELAPSGSPGDSRVDAHSCVTRVVGDWAQTAGVQACTAEQRTQPAFSEARVWMDLPDEPLEVHFEAEHLRRLLVNLLDNALRHATPTPGAITLRLAVRDRHSAVLSFASDGAPIAADVEPHLFEPFFSTRSRGSGLGLYICRELCERYGATIEYRSRPAQDRHRNGFVVMLRRARADGPFPPEHPVQAQPSPGSGPTVDPGPPPTPS